MSEVNIFEQAVKKKLRFASTLGELTTEQLYDLPLISGTRSVVNLDALARATSKELKDLTEESFVEVKPDPRRGDLQLRLDVLKAVITDKLAAKEAADKRLATAQKRRVLLEALDAQQTAAVGRMSKDEIEKALAELGD